MIKDDILKCLNESVYYDFEQFEKTCKNKIVQMTKDANKELEKYGLFVRYEDDYDFDGKEWVAAIDFDSQTDVHEILIAFNLKYLYDFYMSEGFQESELSAQLKVSMWHEIAHGIINYLEESEYDVPFSYDDEDVCEEFARFKIEEYSGQHNSKLNDFLSTIFESAETSFKKYTNSEMGEIVSSGKLKYSGKVPKSFVQKALWNDESTWYTLEDSDGNILAALTTVEVENSLLIEEFMSFQKGAGSKLLSHVLSFDYDMIYLFADWSQKESLLEYYRDKRFGFEEKVMNNSDSHETHYFYLNKKLSPLKLKRFIEKNFIV